METWKRSINQPPFTGNRAGQGISTLILTLCLAFVVIGLIAYWIMSRRDNVGEFKTQPIDAEVSYSNLRREVDSFVSDNRSDISIEQAKSALRLSRQIKDPKKRFVAECQSLEQLADLTFSDGKVNASIRYRNDLLNRLKDSTNRALQNASKVQSAIIKVLESSNIKAASWPQLATAKLMELQAELHDFHEQPYQAMEKYQMASENYNQVLGSDNLMSALIAPRWIELRLRYSGIQDSLTEIDQVERILAKNLGADHRRVLTLMIPAATHHEVLGNARQAAQVLGDFLAQAEKTLDRDDPAILYALTQRGFGLSRSGDFVGATDGYDRAEDWINQFSRNAEYERAKLNFFRLDTHMSKQSFGEAVELGKSSIKRLETLFDSTGSFVWDSPSRESIRRLLAGICQRTGKCLLYQNQKTEEAYDKNLFLERKQQSLELVKKSQLILEDLGLTRTLRYAWVMRDRCEHCYWESGTGFYEPDLENGLKFIKRGMSIYGELTGNGNSYQMPRFQNHFANILRELADPNEAIKIYDQAIADAPDSLLGKWMVAVSLHDKGITLYQLEQRQDAVECMVKAIDLYGSTYFSSLLEHDESEANQLTLNMRRTLRDFVEVIDSENPQHVATVFEYVARIKGIVSRSMSIRSRILNSPDTEKLCQDYRVIVNKISKVSLGDDDAMQMQELTRRKRRLINQIGRFVDSADYRFEANALDRLGVLLPNKTALVEFYWQQRTYLLPIRKYHAFVLTTVDGKTKLHLINLGDGSVIDDLVREVYQGRRGASLQGDSSRGTGTGITPRDLTGSKQKLKQLIWDKIQPSFGDCKTVLVCGDGSTSRIAWSEIPGSQPGKLLVDEYAISHFNNVREVIDLLASDRLTNDKVVAVGGLNYGPVDRSKPLQHESLPNTLPEIQNFAETFPDGSVTELSGNRITKQTVAEQLKSASIAYFATHGIVKSSESSPHPYAGCALVLSNANAAGKSGDWYLSGEDITAMDLRNLDLVVLSACSSATGTNVDSEGISGLQKAFILAGAKSCLASLWEVNDADARQFMSFFVDNLFKKGLSTSEALRKSQQEMRAESHGPEAWANWRLMGDWR